MKRWTPKQIKSLRVKHNISQAAMGTLLGVTTNYVYLLEKGVKTPSNTLKLLLDCVEEKLKKRRNNRKDRRGDLHSHRYRLSCNLIFHCRLSRRNARRRSGFHRFSDETPRL